MKTLTERLLGQLLMAAVAGGAFFAPAALAEDQVCINAEGGVVVKMRIRSKSYVGPWSGNVPSPATHCMDVRRVPVGECYLVEIDPKLWRRSNYDCAKKPRERTGYHRGKKVFWNISTTLWKNKCNGHRYPNGRYYNYDLTSVLTVPSFYHDDEVVRQHLPNRDLKTFDWANWRHNRCLR